MRPLTILERFISLLIRPFRPKTQMVLRLNSEGRWETTEVPKPTSMSQLDELFGEGQWRLAAPSSKE